MTGTFDNWSKSEKMSKVGDHFEKTVTLPDASEKIFYKVCTTVNCLSSPLLPPSSLSAPRPSMSYSSNCGNTQWHATSVMAAILRCPAAEQVEQKSVKLRLSRDGGSGAP